VSAASTVERRPFAVRLGVAAAVVAAIALIALVADHALALATAGADARRIEELERRSLDETAAAADLHAERERQTAASLARERRARIAAWTLLIAGGLAVAGAKQVLARRPAFSPSLEEVHAERAEPVAPVAVIAARARAGERADPGDDTLDLAVVDALVARHGKTAEAAIPILQAIQERFRHLPDEALRRVCETTSITPAQIAGTSSFYAGFRRSPVGRHVVRVCHGTACHVAGADVITDELRRHVGMEAGQDTDPARRFTIDKVACVGCCSLAPVLMVGEETAGRLTPSSARQLLDALEPDA
jgi:NADH:ubiquinone oxidoreductase subunit E